MQGGGDAVAGDIGHQDRQGIVARGMDIVKITAEFRHGAVSDGDGCAVRYRDLVQYQRLLYFVGDDKVAFQQVELAVLADRFLHGHQVGDPGQELLPVHRFREIIAGAGLDPGNDVRGHAPGRQHDDGKRVGRVGFPDGARHIEPGDPGHHHVKYDEVGNVARVNGFQGAGAGKGGGDRISFQAEIVREHPEYDRVIVNREYGACAGGPRRHCGSRIRREFVEHGNRAGAAWHRAEGGALVRACRGRRAGG